MTPGQPTASAKKRDISIEVRKGTFLTRLDTVRRNLCRASMKMSPSLLVRNVPLLRSETPIPSFDDCAACSGTRQDYPAARATAARGLDGTRRKPEPHIPHKREWELLESATGAISIEVKMGTFLTRDDTVRRNLLTIPISKMYTDCNFSSSGNVSKRG